MPRHRYLATWSSCLLLALGACEGVVVVDDVDLGGSGGSDQTGGMAGQGNEASCPSGTFDHDGRPSTACQSWRVCDPGQYVLTSPSRSRDRECAACTTGTFTSRENERQCADWSDCEPGQAVEAAGTTTADRLCRICPSDTFSDDQNSSDCADCPADLVSEPGSSACEAVGAGGGGTGGASGGGGTDGASGGSGGSASGGDEGYGGAGGGTFTCTGAGILDGYYDADTEHCGEAWTGGTDDAMIDPPCGSGTCFVGDELCASVELPAWDEAEAHYPQAVVGWNFRQDPGGALQNVTADGSGITVHYRADGATGAVRLVISSGGTDYCADVTTSPVTLEWSDFVTECWDVVGHVPLAAGAPIKHMMVMANSNDEPQTITDLCLDAVTFDD